MYITNVTDNNNITSSNYTYTNNCTLNKNNFDLIIPTLILTIPCGLAFNV